MELKDILHYYIGQKYRYNSASYLSGDYGPWRSLTPAEYKSFANTGFFMGQLALRSLSDMTEEDATELCKLITEPKRREEVEVLFIEKDHVHFIDGSRWQGDGVDEYNDLYVYYKQLSPAQFHFLLQRGYDLFGLLEAGLAVDAKTIKG